MLILLHIGLTSPPFLWFVLYLLAWIFSGGRVSKPALHPGAWVLTILPVDESQKENCRVWGGLAAGAHRRLPARGREQVTAD